MTTDRPLDVTTSDSQFRFEGTAESPSLVRVGSAGKFHRLLPADNDYLSEGAATAVTFAFARDLAAARERIRELEDKLRRYRTAEVLAKKIL